MLAEFNEFLHQDSKYNVYYDVDIPEYVATGNGICYGRFVN